MEKFYAKEGKPELDRSVAGWDIGSYQCLMLSCRMGHWVIPVLNAHA